MRNRDDGTIEQGIAICVVVILAIALGWVLRDKGFYFRVEQRPTVEQQK
ncbi:MAG TPA: hypothetical protein IGS53_04830 [Leptolyngbyaceae cyanobacterium M33_DOE_097]|nr:hypothetical protein [Leptolyngbyaceae cyanobacterium M33_DOE_097]